MTFADWLSESRHRILQDGIKEGLCDSAYEFYIGALRRLEPFGRTGTNVFSEDWDLLVILDGTRVDAMEVVEADYSFLSEPDTIRSVGSTSKDWIDRTFTDEHTEAMDDTVYVTANQFSQDILADQEFLLLDEVWRYGWDAEKRTIPARAVTDAAILVGREYRKEMDRCIVHYMQPHFPSIPDPIDDPSTKTTDEKTFELSVWEDFRKGSVDKSRVWESYLQNLRYVLDDVKVLLNNFEAETVRISADHGQAFGEKGVYGHPAVSLSCLQSVPWYRTKATDTGSYVPDERVKQEVADDNIEDQLRALGYK